MTLGELNKKYTEEFGTESIFRLDSPVNYFEKINGSYQGTVCFLNEAGDVVFEPELRLKDNTQIREFVGGLFSSLEEPEASILSEAQNTDELIKLALKIWGKGELDFDNFLYELPVVEE